MRSSSGRLSCSLVICTYNRAPYLNKLLIGLAHLNYRDFEVVVVNGPSTDWTDQLLARYQGRIKVVSNNRELNLSMSRNMGLAAANGDIVVFIDDDAIPADPFWLDRIMRTFEEDGEGRIGAGGGGSLHRHTRYFEFNGGYVNDYCEQVFHKENLSENRRVESRFVRRANGNNCAFRRKILEQIGGWDEHFIYYADEADVCFRIAQRGYETAYIDESHVRHFPAPAHYGAPLIRNRRLVTRSDTYFSLKNGEDAWLPRMLKTLWKAPQKHYFEETFTFRKEKKISWFNLLGFLLNWMIGLLQGFFIGVFSRRRTNLATYETGGRFIPFITENKLAGKRRVCVVSKEMPGLEHAGGIARYKYDLAWGMHELGHEVHLFVEDDYRIRFENLDFYVHGIGQKEKPDIPVSSQSLANMLAYSTAIYFKLRELAARGIVFDFMNSGTWDLVSLISTMKDQCPNIARVHTPHETVFTYDVAANPQERHLVNALEHWMIRNVSGVVLSSNSHINYLRKMIRFELNETKRNRIVQQGIKPTPVASIGVYPRNNRKRILFVGRFERRKGIDLILDVIPDLLARYKNWECHLVGRQSTETSREILEAFEARHHSARWRDRLFMPGAATDSELFQYYAGSDIFMAPSRYESFGLIYLEAMQYGIACVGPEVGGVPTIIEDGRTGLLVEPGSADSLREALEKLINDDDLRSTIGAEGQRRFQEFFTHTRMARDTLKFCEDVAGPFPDSPFEFVDPMKVSEEMSRSAHAWIERQEEASDLTLECLELIDGTEGLADHKKTEVLFKKGREGSLSAVQELIELAEQKHLNPSILDALLHETLHRNGRQACGLLLDALLSRVDSGALEKAEYAVLKLAMSVQGSNNGENQPMSIPCDVINQNPNEAIQALRTLAKSGNGEALKRLAVNVFGQGPSRVPLRFLSELHYHIGSLLKREGSLDEAEKHMATIIAGARESGIHTNFVSGAHFHLGEIAWSRQNRKIARLHFKKTLSLSPNHRKAAEYLEKS